MKSNINKKYAFTLIELLIVVAIIAILALIAVPNFLEAQTRSKVSRVKADMRSVAVALESYAVDHNAYPKSLRQVGQTRKWMYRQLTTPIAYITSAPPDPFNVSEADPDNRVFPFWTSDSFEISTQSYGIILSEVLPNVALGATPPYLTTKKFWVLLSYSPDQDFDCMDNPKGAIRNTANGWPQPIQEYDPSNGTISDGDVFKSNLAPGK